MNQPQVETLEAQLTRLTSWDGDTTDLWQRALQRSASSGAENRWTVRALWRRTPLWLLPAGGVAAVLVLLVPMLTISLSTTRNRAKSVADFDSSSPQASRDSMFLLNGAGADATRGRFISPSAGDTMDDLRNRGPADVPAGGRGAFSNDNTEWFPHHYAHDGNRGGILYNAASQPTSESPRPASNSTAERHVVRKATVELTAPDVRATFLKAGQLISEARSEYVQDSALTGTGNQLQVNLTLRVAADRLSAVLNDLRQLGEVRSERSDGQDVTTQVVDLEARLRNEQRVEVELLNLLETRKDAPLKEILDLRTNLGSVRNVIEQLTAQRQTLARLVSLATILVIIRPPDAPVAAPPPTGIGAYFRESVAAAWNKGLQVLADTLAVVLGALIGGLPWWILIAGVVVALRAMRRRARSS